MKNTINLVINKRFSNVTYYKCIFFMLFLPLEFCVVVFLIEIGKL